MAVKCCKSGKPIHPKCPFCGAPWNRIGECRSDDRTMLALVDYCENCGAYQEVTVQLGGRPLIELNCEGKPDGREQEV